MAALQLAQRLVASVLPYCLTRTHTVHYGLLRFPAAGGHMGFLIP